MDTNAGVPNSGPSDDDIARAARELLNSFGTDLSAAFAEVTQDEYWREADAISMEVDPLKRDVLTKKRLALLALDLLHDSWERGELPERYLLAEFVHHLSSRREALLPATEEPHDRERVAERMRIDQVLAFLECARRDSCLCFTSNGEEAEAFFAACIENAEFIRGKSPV